MTIPYRLRVLLHRLRTRLGQTLRKLLGRTSPSWHRKPNAKPWFDDDEPTALAQIGARAAPDRAPLLEKWVRDGYIVAEDFVDPADIDAMISTLDGLWEAREPIANLELLGLRESRREAQRTLSHGELLALDPATRLRMKESSDWRIHGFHYINPAARSIFSNRKLRDLASLLFGRKARPFAVINFLAGSQQTLHQDMAVFHIYPHNYLIGAWIACEDIGEGCGPLVFYPGSHRTPMFPEFTDYPQTNLRTGDEAMAARYQAYVDGLATRFPRREFFPRKGQILLWHGMLIHGGAEITNPASTRKSMVIHYTVRGADRGREVHGPFRW